VQLQYNIELAIGGFVDGPPTKDREDTIAKRLDALRAYRRAWMSLTPRRKMSISVESEEFSSAYTFSGGIWADASLPGHLLTLEMPSIIRGKEIGGPQRSQISDTLDKLTIDPAQDLLAWVDISECVAHGSIV
jgi:hypothetical protein